VLDINVEKESVCTVVWLTGRLDATTSNDLEDCLLRLLDEGEVRFIMEMSGTEYISSSGLRVLLLVTKQVYGTGHFCLCSLSDHVREIIEMAGFTSFVPVYEDLDTAIQAIELNEI